MSSSIYAVIGQHLSLAVVLVLSGCGSSEDRTDRSLREAARAYPRPVEGRLSASTLFAPWDTSGDKAHLYDPAPLPDDTGGQVLRGSRPSSTAREPEELHRLGLLALYHGKAARAVSTLEVAAERNPSAAVLSDLAAAYLALAEEDRPWLRIDALAAATRAVEQAPSEPYAAFNLALAIERLSLAHQASLAWMRYVLLEQDEPWQEEALERLARLHKPTAHDSWEWEAQKGRVASADRATLIRLARQFPREFKELIERDLLSAWAEAVGTPTEGARLATAKRVAEALAGSGERIYVDAIRVIESRPEASQALAEGHQAYAKGLTFRGDCPQAMPLFEHASERFSTVRSPFSEAARYQQLVCIYRSRPPDAEESLDKLASELQEFPYPTLLAKTETLRGLCAMADGRHSQAVANYERALKLLKGIGDNDVRRIYGMLDEAYRFLGDRNSVWRYRLESLSSAVAARDLQIRHAILAGLARDLVGANRREAAQVVLDEMLANGRAWSEPGAEAEVLLRRIQLHLRNGFTDRAAADITECAQVLKRYQQPADRKRLETELMIASGEQQLATDPTEALNVIMSAISRLEARADTLLLPRALLALARARVSLADPEAAEEALDRALQFYEARREGIGREELRISFFSTAQASFDAMIRFQALERMDARTAFIYAEQVRARALRDQLEDGRKASEPLPLDEQLGRIPSNVAIFAYAVLPKALLIWRLRQDSLKMYELPVTRREVAEAVDSFRTALKDASSLEAGRTAAAKAFAVLLRPALEGLPAQTELVFMPDRELHQVPFSALFDTSRGRYLIEDHPCLVVPSLNNYLASQERGTSAIRRPRRVLAVGDPSFDRGRFPDLPHLPSARQEAFTVATLYNSGLPLVDKEASRRRILKELQGSDVFHLAAHVVVDPRNALNSFVATADLGREPLRAFDLDAERLAGIQLVFLAACDTAPSFEDGDREGIAGLARAFLSAGIPSVIATLWAVDDQAAARLAMVFHAHLVEGETPAQALRLSQLALLSDSSTPPFAWAPFQLFRGL
jgi:CHAT domain-containing protein